MIPGPFGVSWFAFAAVAAALAVTWTLVHPPVPQSGRALPRLMLRWGHAASWLVLAAAFALKGLGLDAAGNIGLVLGVVIHAAFLMSFATTPRGR